MLRSFLASVAIGIAVFLALRAEAPVAGVVGIVFLTAFVAVLIAQIRTEPEVNIGRPGRHLPVGFGRALLERVPSPLMVISDKGRITYANTAATQLLPSILIGDHFASLARAPVFVEAVNASLQDGEQRQVEFQLPKQDRIFEAQIARLPAGSEFGDNRQVIVRVEDRTEAHRTAEMRSTFIANASHELRTPLASLLGYIETLREHGKDDPEAQERFLTIMDKQAHRMQRLVDDLMSLSRIEMEAHVLPENVAGLHALVLEAASSLRPMLKKAGVSIHVDPSNDDPAILCDPDQVLQVATNLIDNAAKYGDGEVMIRFLDPDPARPGMAGFAVEDQGMGIPKHEIHRLTERFFRVNVAKSKETGGTGLGLAIVKHILNRHGGDLVISSELRKGSRFSVWLPLAESDESAAVEIAKELS